MCASPTAGECEACSAGWGLNSAGKCEQCKADNCNKVRGAAGAEKGHAQEVARAADLYCACCAVWSAWQLPTALPCLLTLRPAPLAYRSRSAMAISISAR